MLLTGSKFLMASVNFDIRISYMDKLVAVLKFLSPFGQVRFSNGAVASFGLDRLARALNFLSLLAVLVAVITIVMDDDRLPNFYWYSILAFIYMTVILSKVRLRWAVKAAECDDCKLRNSLSARLSKRLFASLADTSSKKAEMLLSKASEAEIHGNFSKAETLRRRYQRELQRAEKARISAEGRSNNPA